MSLTMNMLSVITQTTPPGPIPEGMKVTALTGPDTLDPAPACPVLAIGSFVLWPMSYIDNRVSFGMVMYNPSNTVANQQEKPGARYVYQITLNDAEQTVTFSGQANQTVTMTLDDIWQLMI